ncbi:regulatory particle non-ATPase 12A [Actinidia rufa]|uniref:Regulatory particle non-ATPase 12A n=1 Tax=Actinidia rufa TaxID=165716 RepID=A0A7J0DNF9_9ERIC|nr:regulatory particle non-ATPase 12A [Actinidia rufa]
MSMRLFFSVKIEDQDTFERDFFQLKPYYTDARGRLPPSPQEYPILGLNLLRLLVQNRIAEFHTELELLSASSLENPCIKHAVELEQSFMEGAYNRVLSARQTVPMKLMFISWICWQRQSGILKLPNGSD